MKRPIYYRWAYSPSTGEVTLAHNHEGHPADIRFHSDMAQERQEDDLVFGLAHKADSSWQVTTDDARPIDDPNILYEVVRAITKYERHLHHGSEVQEAKS